MRVMGVSGLSGGLVNVAMVFAMALSSVHAAGGSDETNPHQWQPKTKSVAVFKNGLGFFMREGDVALRDGWCVAEQVPPAAFGTLAIHATVDGETVDMVGGGSGDVVQFDDRDESSDPAVKLRRLKACEGIKVQLDYEYRQRSRSSLGKLVSINSEFAVLDDENNLFAVPLEGISKLQVKDENLPLRIHVARRPDESQVPVSSLAMAEEFSKTRLGMAYLRKGITWIPEYTLQVLDDETAELTLRGTIVNEAEDLIHSDVHLVVGVPHFIHTDYMAPMAAGQAIRTIATSVAPQAVMTQMMQNAAIVSNGFQSNQLEQAGGTGGVSQPGGNIDAVMSSLPQMDNSVASDYTVYTKEDVTLRRGEKAIVTLFKKRISFSHIYRWNLPGTMRHALRLHNETDTAWTTGPCLAVRDTRPLSEDLMKYTPKGGSGELPMTDAINVAQGHNEEEVDRELKAHNPYSNVYYDLVTLDGEIELRNFEQREVQIVITAPVPGKPIEASEDGRMVADPTRLKLLERQGTITWQVTLKPQERKMLTYTYQRYVESH